MNIALVGQVLRLMLFFLKVFYNLEVFYNMFISQQVLSSTKNFEQKINFITNLTFDSESLGLTVAILTIYIFYFLYYKFIIESQDSDF